MQANNEKVNYPKTQEAGVVQQVLASKANKTKWKKKKPQTKSPCEMRKLQATVQSLSGVKSHPDNTFILIILHFY